MCRGTLGKRTSNHGSTVVWDTMGVGRCNRAGDILSVFSGIGDEASGTSLGEDTQQYYL